MKTNHIKLLTIAAFTFSVFAILISNTDTAVRVKADGDVATEYKAKCAMCHSPKAEKSFDPTKSIAAHTEVILKGNKTSKPPMPGYEAKGMTADGAKALAEYMVTLRTPAAANTTTNTTGNSPSNTNANSDRANTPATPVPPVAKFDENTAAMYKAKCAMCHSPKAEKFFDATKADDVLATVVMKGNSTSKPPMPGYEAKGMKAEEATALVALMRSLKQ